MLVDPEDPKNSLKNTKVSKIPGFDANKAAQDYRTFNMVPPPKEWEELKERLRKERYGS